VRLFITVPALQKEQSKTEQCKLQPVSEAVVEIEFVRSKSTSCIIYNTLTAGPIKTCTLRHHALFIREACVSCTTPAYTPQTRSIVEFGMWALLVPVYGTIDRDRCCWWPILNRFLLPAGSTRMLDVHVFPWLFSPHRF
jgi:hypothetical protein